MINYFYLPICAIYEQVKHNYPKKNLNLVQNIIFHIHKIGKYFIADKLLF